MSFVRNQETKVAGEAADAVENPTKAAVARVCALPAKPLQFHVMATVNARVLFAAASMQFDVTWNANELCAAQ